MNRRSILAAPLVFLSLAACHRTGVVPSETDRSFISTGRILVRGPIRGPSASFDANRVIGPAINVSRRSDGTWAGWIRDRAVNLHLKGNEIGDASVTLRIQELPDGVEVRGLWIQAPRSQDISIRVTATEFYAREPHVRPPIYLESAEAPGHYGRGAFANAVELVGEAALPHPPEPQFALALLGAL